MELDDAYANVAYIPEAEAFPPRWIDAAQVFRDRLGATSRAHLGLSYGVSDRSAYDVFFPETPAKGLLIFVHGGYWRRFNRTYWSHFATGPLAQGWAVAMPSYDLCPDVSIADITRQVALAVEVIAGDFDGPLRLCGHSAGGHLVSRLTSPDLLDDSLRARIEHMMVISPVSDLRPLLKTSMNAIFGMTEQDAIAESPALHPVPENRVTVWVGADERPVFLDQSRWLAKAWGAHGVIESGKHHFDVIDGLLDGESKMTRTLLG